jgi:FAD/FMN-containing dehydrogenase
MPQSPAIAELTAQMPGRVIRPGDAGYDAARTVFYGGHDARPAAVVRVKDAREVAEAVTLARTSGLPLAVRSGGHSNAGHSTMEGGIVIDLSAMKAIGIDAKARTAWAETGVTASEFTKAAAAQDLGVGFGDAGSVGLGGLTLGGGVGYLARKHGLTIDALLAAEIVTADGTVRAIDDKTLPDLFWAIRGGGGNFGVVTRLKFRLYELKGIYGGLLILPATADVIAGFVDLAGKAPEELSTIANIMPAPPMPMVPADMHGKLVVFAMLVFAGDAAAGEKAVAPFRALAKPVADLVKPMTLPEVYPPEDASYHPTAVFHTQFADHIDRAAAAKIMEYLSASEAAMRVAQLRVLGGAVARVAADATAYAHRASRIMVNVAAFYDTPQNKRVRQKWVDDFAAALRQKDAGAYVNFLGAEGEERVRAAYPGATFDRLQRIKRQYDPANLFRLNQNIPPA